MNPIEDKAIEYFRSGFNCSQSVLSAFSEIIDVDKELALRIACGFGAGMGRLQGTCGAVTASYMVLGLYATQKHSENSDRKELSYSMIQEFERKFLSIHHSTDCRALLNCDLKTEEGHQKMQVNNLSETVCEVCISDAIGILYEIIQGY